MPLSHQWANSPHESIQYIQVWYGSQCDDMSIFMYNPIFLYVQQITNNQYPMGTDDSIYKMVYSICTDKIDRYWNPISIPLSEEVLHKQNWQTDPISCFLYGKFISHMGQIHSDPIYYISSLTVSQVEVNSRELNLHIRNTPHKWSGACHNPSQTHHKFKCYKIIFFHNIHLGCRFILKFCTEYGSITAVPCAKFQNNWASMK